MVQAVMKERGRKREALLQIIVDRLLDKVMNFNR